jgi:hypothetical protein
MNLLTDEQIIQMTEQYCKRRLKDLVFMLHYENTFSSFLVGTLAWLEASGFHYKYNSVDNSKILAIQFNMGRN